MKVKGMHGIAVTAGYSTPRHFALLTDFVSIVPIPC